MTTRKRKRTRTNARTFLLSKPSVSWETGCAAIASKKAGAVRPTTPVRSRTSSGSVSKKSCARARRSCCTFATTTLWYSRRASGSASRPAPGGGSSSRQRRNSVHTCGFASGSCALTLCTLKSTRCFSYAGLLLADRYLQLRCHPVPCRRVHPLPRLGVILPAGARGAVVSAVVHKNNFCGEMKPQGSRSTVLGSIVRTMSMFVNATACH